MKLQNYKNKVLANDPQLNEAYLEAQKLRELGIKIGQKIKRCRVSQGVTQKILAERLKTHQPSIAQIENGSFIPSIKFLSKLASVLNSEIALDLPVKNTTTESRLTHYTPNNSHKNWIASGKLSEFSATNKQI